MWIQVPRTAALQERATMGGDLLAERTASNNALNTMNGYSTPAPNGAYIFIDGLAEVARFVDRAMERHPVRSFVATSPTFGSIERPTLTELVTALRGHPTAEGVTLSLVTTAATPATPAPDAVIAPAVTGDMLRGTPIATQIDVVRAMDADEAREEYDVDDDDDDLRDEEDEPADAEEAELAKVGAKVCGVDAFVPSPDNGKLTLPVIDAEYQSLLNGANGSNQVQCNMAEGLIGLSKVHVNRDPVVSDLPQEILKVLDEKTCDVPSWNLENALLMAQIAGCLPHATRFSPHKSLPNRESKLDIRYLQLSEVVFGHARKMVDKISPLSVGHNSRVFRDVLLTYRAMLRTCVHSMTANQLFFGAQEGKYKYPAGTDEATKYPNGRSLSVGFVEVDHYSKSEEPDNTEYDRDGRFQLHKVVVPKFPLEDAHQLCQAHAQKLLDVVQSEAFASELIHRIVLGDALYDEHKDKLSFQDVLDNTVSQVDGLLVAHLSGAKSVVTKIIGMPHAVQTSLLSGLLAVRETRSLDVGKIVNTLMGSAYLPAELAQKFDLNLQPMIQSMLVQFGPAVAMLRLIAAKIKMNLATALTSYVNVCVNAGVAGPHVLIGFRGVDLKNVGVLMPQGAMVELFRQNVVKSRSTAPKDLLSSKRLRDLQKYLGERAFAVVDALKAANRLSVDRSVLILAEADGSSSESGPGMPYVSEHTSVSMVLYKFGQQNRKVLMSGGALLVEFADLVLDFQKVNESEYPNIKDKLGIAEVQGDGLLWGRLSRLDCKPHNRPGSVIANTESIKARLEDGATIPERLHSFIKDECMLWADDVDLGATQGADAAMSLNSGAVKLSYGSLCAVQGPSIFGASHGSYGTPQEAGVSKLAFRFFRIGMWLGWLHHNKIEDVEQAAWWIDGVGARFTSPMVGKGLSQTHIDGAKRLCRTLAEDSDNGTPWFDFPSPSRTGEMDARGNDKLFIGCTILEGGNRIVFHQRFCRAHLENLAFEVGINLLVVRKFGSSMFRDTGKGKVSGVDYIEAEFSKEYSRIALSNNKNVVREAMHVLREAKEHYKSLCRDKIPLARRMAKEIRQLKQAGGMIDMEKHAKNLVERKVIQGFRVRGDALKIKTNEINLICGPAIYLFGEYSVSLRDFFAGGNPEGPRVQFWNLTRQVNSSHDHPHVRGGNPCLGNLRGMLTKSIKDRDLTTSISLLIGYLQSVNLQDQYGETMQRTWPYVPCNLANLIRYGVEDGLLNNQLLLQVQAKNDKSKMTVRTIKDLAEKGELQALLNELWENKATVLGKLNTVIGVRGQEGFGSFKDQIKISQAHDWPANKIATKRTPEQLLYSFDTAVKYLISCYGCSHPETTPAEVPVQVTK